MRAALFPPNDPGAQAVLQLRALGNDVKSALRVMYANLEDQVDAQGDRRVSGHQDPRNSAECSGSPTESSTAWEPARGDR